MGGGAEKYVMYFSKGKPGNKLRLEPRMQNLNFVEQGEDVGPRPGLLGSHWRVFSEEVTSPEPHMEKAPPARAVHSPAGGWVY